jgi:acyl carrier protein
MAQNFLEQIKSVLEIESKELSFNDKFREYPTWDSLVYLFLIALLNRGI